MSSKVKPVLSLTLSLTLAACGAAQATPPTPTAAPFGRSGFGAGQGNSLESRLAVGTLELEGTSQAVTAGEAKQLLPLWQQVQSDMGSGSGAAPDLQSTYQQIEQDMTADQIQAIQNMSLNQSDIQTLMQNLGIQTTPNAGPGSGAFPTLSPEAQATREARATGTPGARFLGGGFERVFVGPLIQLLQQRAGV